MVKKDLVDDLVQAFPGISEKDMVALIKVLYDGLAEALMAGETIEIRGFGRLSVRRRSAIRARNPRSGIHVDVPERWAVHFKPSESLISRVNRNS